MTLGPSYAFRTFERAAGTEYIVTSGSGAYSSSPICGANTRRYHALLATTFDDPPGVYVCLSALEEVLDIGGARFFLSTAEYPGAVFPEGYHHLRSFSMDPLPEFLFEIEGVSLRKMIALGRDESTVVVSYELLSDARNVALEVRPLAAFRPRHELAEANETADLSAGKRRGWYAFKPYDSLPAVRMKLAGEFVDSPGWYRRVQYRRERERGHGRQEDLLTPGVFRVPLSRGKPVYFMATLEKNTGRPAALLEAAEHWAHEWANGTRRLPTLVASLAGGLKDLFVRTGKNAGLLRGLPWHSQWARHTMMALAALPSLGKLVETREILDTWARRAKGGLLPLYIDDAGEPRETDVEGTLWFFEALEHCLAASGNYEWVRQALGDFLHEFLDSVIDGKCEQARLGENGLLYTWASSRPLAPREGGPFALVEIQALYFNALKIAERLAAHFRNEKKARRYFEAARAVHKAYNRFMWDSDHHVPADLFADAPDLTTRPMCLLAVSLSHPILVRRRWEILIDQVESALLTPFGLLAVPMDYPGSKTYFPGDSYEDARRHGGVWPEFLGAYLAAHTKTFGRSAARAEATLEYLKPLELTLAQGLFNHVSEFFDGAEPYAPRGALANAAASGQLIWALTSKVEPRHYGGEED